MRFGLIRHLILLITLGAFLGAGVVQAAWPTKSEASTEMAMMPGNDAGVAMPCPGKTMVPGCMTDLGCIFMIGLPTISPSATMTRLSWIRVSYGDLSQVSDGLTHKPALGPPIFRG